MKKTPLQKLHAIFRDWIVILVLLCGSVFTVQMNADLLKTSLFESKQHAPFDGTVYPLAQVPDYNTASSTDLVKNFHDFPVNKLIDIPEYRNDYLIFPSDDLIWGNSAHNVIRNTKITYSVAYAGNYSFDDSGEGHGSHPAVDIKALEGTPVYAIANGIVTKVSYQAGGFGNHVVIEHRDVPKPGNPGAETTLHSSYSHMLKSLVAEGDIVRKGQVIGEVGRTGTATTNHLHFQLDSNLAPWHPYWPFTTSEINNAGLDFWSAINEGFGKDNVYKYTYNPMNWVMDHENGTIVSNTNDEEEDEEEVIVEEDEPEVVIEETVTTAADISDIKVTGPLFVLLGSNENFTVELEDFEFDGNISVSVSDSNLANVSPSTLSAGDFNNNGEAELQLYASQAGNVSITLSADGEEFESQSIQMLSDVKPFARFGVFHDGQFSPREIETITIQALDADGNPTPSFNAGGTIELSAIQGAGAFNPSRLTRDDFRSGVAEVEFTATADEDVVVLALYGRAKAESKVMDAKLFEDLSSAHENYSAVSFLFKKGTVQGYPDGTFKPGQTVSRVEALKIIFSGMDQPVRQGLRLSFSDAYNDQWYTDYVATAESNGVVEGYPDGSFKPGQGVNRVEFLKMLFNSTDLEVNENVNEDPYSDVSSDDWFAPYVQFAKEKNLFPIDGNDFHPANPMERAEVAEVIYRLILIQQNNADAFSDVLASVSL